MEFLFPDAAGKPLWMWLGFLILVSGLLAFDLGVLHRGHREIGARESLILSAFYVAIGVSFALFVGRAIGRDAAFDYLTGFVVEKSLALDNIFVIALIFRYFAIPRSLQHRVLFYGFIGVMVLRAIMIGAGAAIVSRFEWVLVGFAAFLVITGLRMLFPGKREYDVEKNPVLHFLRRHLRLTGELHGDRFFVWKTAGIPARATLFATPLFLALVMVELADIVFAVDSIPAIFTITTDPYVVYTSNIFAVLGLRALFFSLSALMQRFAYLSTALALVLVFIGGKVIVSEVFAMAHMPALFSLSVTVLILSGGILASWILGSAKRGEPRIHAPSEAAADDPVTTDGTTISDCAKRKKYV